jgi:hypothetical protein
MQSTTDGEESRVSSMGQWRRAVRQPARAKIENGLFKQCVTSGQTESGRVGLRLSAEFACCILSSQLERMKTEIEAVLILDI